MTVFVGGAHGVKVSEDDGTLIGFAAAHGQPLHSDHAVAQSAQAGAGPVDREKQTAIADLEAARRQAVANEDYEGAARLRDEVTALKSAGGPVSEAKVRQILADQLASLGDFASAPGATTETIAPSQVEPSSWDADNA